MVVKRNDSIEPSIVCVGISFAKLRSYCFNFGLRLIESETGLKFPDRAQESKAARSFHVHCLRERRHQFERRYPNVSLVGILESPRSNSSNTVRLSIERDVATNYIA